MSGRITPVASRYKMNNGSQTTIVPGMSYTIPPGHDAPVDGDEPFVAIEIMSAETHAKLA